MLPTYILLAVRDLFRNKLHGFINILGLTAGLTGFLILLIYLNHELSYDKWHPELERVYRVRYVQESGFASGNTPVPLAGLLRQNHSAIQNHTLIQPAGDEEILITTGTKKIYQKGLVMADSNFLHVFPLQLKTGNVHTALQNPLSVIISEDLAYVLFGNENPINKVITLFNNIQCPVKGVFYKPKTPSHLRLDLVVTDPYMYQNPSWENYSYQTYVKTSLKESPARLEESFNKILLEKRISLDTNTQEQYSAAVKKPRLVVEQVQDVHNFPKLGSSQFREIFALFLLAVLLLASGIINYSNLSLATAFHKAKEAGIRKVLGSGRAQIIYQLLTSTVLKCFVALVLSIVAVQIMLPVFNNYYQLSLSVSSLVTPSIFLQVGAALTLLVLISGIYPAIVVSASNPAHTLKGQVVLGSKPGRVSNGLVLLQFAVSLLFIVGVVVMEAQLQYLQNRDIGFNPAQVIQVEATQKTRESDFPAVRRKLLSIPGIELVSKSTAVPGKSHIDTSTREFIFNGAKYPMASVRVSTDYFQTLNVPLVRGRYFSDAVPQDQQTTAIVNEAAANLLGGAEQEHLIRFPFCEDLPYQVVGVVKNFNVQGFEHTVKPTIYTISNERCGYQSGGALLLKVNSSNMRETLKQLTHTWSSIEPDFPIRYSFLDQNFARVIESHMRFRSVVSIFAIIAIVISAMGLFAMTAFAVQQKSKEIAIRKVLGATVSNLLMFVSKRFLRLAIIAAVIVVPLSWYLMNEWLNGFAYRIQINPCMFVVAIAASLVITLMAVGIKALRAAASNPVTKLRNE